MPDLRLSSEAWLVLGCAAGFIVVALISRPVVRGLATLPALAPVPWLSRRLSGWVRARHYSDSDFLAADGASATWGRSA